MADKTNQDNAAGTSKSDSSLTGPCSLSWLLIKNDHAWVAKHGKYCVIHAMQVTSHTPKDIYVGTAVSFRMGNDEVKGEVLSGADDIQLVNDDMKEWVDNDRIADMRCNNFLLVQYRPTPVKLVHRIFSQADVTHLMTKSKISSRDVFIRDGPKMCQALVLTRSSSLDEMENELCKLRTKVYEATRTSLIHRVPFYDPLKVPEDNPWVFLQYNCTLSDCIYTIVRYEDTGNPPSEMYPEVQTFFNTKRAMIPAMILYKSQSLEELMIGLNMIANSCQISIYPPSQDTDFRNAHLVKYELPNLRPRPAYTFHKVSKSDIAKCHLVTKYIEKEAIMISELIEAMDTADEEMDCMLKQLTRLRDEISDLSIE